jgi:ferredoxin
MEYCYVSYVVTEACIQCKHTDCVAVCQVNCFHEGPNFLVIDPDECIECGLCEPECPLDAIVAENALLPEQLQFRALNRDLARLWPAIEEPKGQLPEAEQWAQAKDKLHLLAR